MKKEELERNTEKFLCHCSKITYKKFEKELFSNTYSKLENLYQNLNLARHFFTITTPDHKLMIMLGDKAITINKFSDLKNDPYELNNLFKNKKILIIRY